MILVLSCMKFGMVSIFFSIEVKALSFDSLCCKIFNVIIGDFLVDDAFVSKPILTNSVLKFIHFREARI